MIRLSPQVFARLDALTRARPHDELCGLLAGQSEGGEWRVGFFLLTRDRNPWGAFWITPLEFDVARRTARARGETLIAVFHAHPSGAITPSTADLRAIQAGRLFWVLGVRREGSLRLAAFAPGSAKPEEIGVGDAAHAATAQANDNTD